MLFRMIYDDKLAQASYLIGCQRTGEAIVIDPERDVDRYLQLAEKEHLHIAAVAETHIHADFLSGSRELAERLGTKVYVSGEGGDDWQYGWLEHSIAESPYRHRVLHDGDTFAIGNIEFRAIHTPGHTPEHVCYAVTDRGGGATEPMGVLTGDFIFVGDVGRPDLLETAAGHAGVKERSARDLFASLRRFSELPDWVQLWPAHGSGSACGKALGAVPQTTLGYERRFNPSLRAAGGEERGFVDFILAGQPEPPLYFARMKKDNRDGPPVLGALPTPREVSAGELSLLEPDIAAIIDTRPWDAFLRGHARGALSIPLDNQFNTIAGSYIQPGRRIYLIIAPDRVGEAVRDLVRVGLDEIVGFVDPAAMDQYAIAGGRTVSLTDVEASELKDLLRTPSDGRASPENGLFILDVRSAGEFAAGHIPGAVNIAHTRLAGHLDRLPRNRPIVVNCRSGARSARATALLHGQGFDVQNLAGGILAWEHDGGPIEH
jgi:hydroxyacylglutathione hydrolase